MLHITNNSFYSCQPKTKEELQGIIIKRIVEDGDYCDLNDIDVSKIEDMSSLFYCLNFSNAGAYAVNKPSNIFEFIYVDISLWNVSNVKNMAYMFYRCKQFDCDISRWDVSNVTDMRYMFKGCKRFYQDLNNWDVSNVKYMINAFEDCPTQPKWYKNK